MVKPHIYYYLRELTNIPTGGVKAIFRHVEILNQQGFNAFVLTDKKWFGVKRPTWFSAESVPVKQVNLSRFKLNDEDFVVFPELYGPDTAQKIVGGKKIIFNQNAYYTFRGGYDFDVTHLTTPYLDRSVKAVMVVSEDSADYIHYVFPQVKIFRVHIGIDDKLFYYSPQKKKQIAFMPRKSRQDILQVVNILKQRGVLKNYTVVPIENVPELKLLEILRESLFFLSSGYFEGWPAPPAEAMACGCITIGYHGWGARESLRSEWSYPIEEGDIIGFAKTLEQAILEYEANPSFLDVKRQKASAFILENYSVDREKRDVLSIWSELLRLK
jgi:glycosyltransferase involved in cell wall biosynthesis